MATEGSNASIGSLATGEVLNVKVKLCIKSK